MKPSRLMDVHTHTHARVCLAHCWKVCTAKALSKLHLKLTQHHSYDVVGEDESEAEIC